MFSWWFLSVSWYFSIIRHMSREPDFSAKNRIFKNFLKCPKACLVGVLWVFQSISSIVRHLGREPDFWAENRIFKNFLKSLKTCLVGVFWVFQGILAKFEICAENHIFEPRTEFSRISQKASKYVLLVFSGCFNVYFFSIVRHLSREPVFWAENQIFKKFLKSLKTCLVGVFWVFHVFV